MDASPLLTAIAVCAAMAVLGAILAVGYLASRIIEGTIMMVGIAATLLLIPLSQEFLKAGTPQGSWFQTMGDVLMHAHYLDLTGSLSSCSGWVDYSLPGCCSGTDSFHGLSLWLV